MLPTYKNLPKNSVLCLMSPTASGKTALACQLYDTGVFELISVDSALIYRGMNIGTAKPTADELRRYPHHLVDIISPTDSYSVANFVQDVQVLIEQIHARGKLPLLVGGTMMYYMALFDGISSVPQTDEAVRERVKRWLDGEGNAALYDYLRQHDPQICQRLTVNDTQRISRAVEVHLQTGTPMSVWQNTPKSALSHDPRWHWYGLSVLPNRAWLHERIALRLEMMWADGFVDEVIDLLHHYPDLQADMPSMRCVGYRQVLQFLAKIQHPAMMAHERLRADFALDNLPNQSQMQNYPENLNISPALLENCTKTTADMWNLACQDMKNQALYATRQLAKRQYTWLRKLTEMEQNSTQYNTHGNITNRTMLSFDCIEQVQQMLLGR